MRYIVVEYNEREPSKPIIKVFPGRRQAVEYANESPNTCRIFWFGEGMIPNEIEATELVKPE